MDEAPLFFLAAATIVMLLGSIVDSISWLVPLTAPVGVVSAFLSLERKK